MKKNKASWDASKLLTVDTQRGVIDINVLSLKSYYVTRGHRIPLGVLRDYYSENIDSYDEDLNKTAMLFVSFINGLPINSRNTTVRAICKFFFFQFSKGLDVGSKQGLKLYCADLSNDVMLRKFNSNTANGKFSHVNTFLISLGELSVRHEHDFGTAYSARDSSVEPYRKKDFSEIIVGLISIFNKMDVEINHHIDQVEKGLRKFSIYDLSFVLSHKTLSDKKEHEYMGGRAVQQLMLSSYFLFCLYTWGNTSVMKEINVDSVEIDDDGVETDYIFKGRAHKFVRLNIGVSSVDSEIAGYKWFKRFIKTRKKLLDYLIKYEHSVLDTKTLFVQENRVHVLHGEIRSYKPIISSRLSEISNKGLFGSLRSDGYTIPRITVGRIRKTAEQYSDQVLKNPLVIIDKAQHELSTYRKSYSKGNALDSREEMTNALRSIQESGLNVKKFSQRKDEANKYGVVLEKPSKKIKPLLNGFGCMKLPEKTVQEKEFLRNQKKLGRNPKACADFAKCVDCEKCAVIEDVDAIYNLLSFKETLEYEKPTYIKSSGASGKFESLINKIELRLSFVSESIINQALSRLQDKGVAAVWNI
ncbi:MAG: hypothetical protein QM500_08750 [Methylococcales bacterium]